MKPVATREVWKRVRDHCTLLNITADLVWLVILACSAFAIILIIPVVRELYATREETEFNWKYGVILFSTVVFVLALSLKWLATRPWFKERVSLVTKAPMKPETRKAWGQVIETLFPFFFLALLLWLLIGEHSAKDFYPLPKESALHWQWWLDRHEGAPPFLVLLSLVGLIYSLTALGAKPIIAIFWTIIIMVGLYYFGPIFRDLNDQPRNNFNARVEQRTQNMNIATKVARDQEERYAIVARSGSPMEICVYAGLVASAWVYAKDEAAYQYWKQIERDGCARVGLQR